MSTLKLTVTKIGKHKPTKADESLTDGNGLYLRVRSVEDGMQRRITSRIWMHTHKVGTKSQYLTIGAYESAVSDLDAQLYLLEPGARLTLETVRKIASKITERRKSKDKPIAPRQYIQAVLGQQEADESARMNREAEETLKRIKTAAAELEREREIAAENLTVTDLFEAWVPDTDRKDKGAEIRRLFNRDVLPAVGARPLKTITEADMRSVLRGVVERGSNRMAVMLLSDLKQMFRWAEKRRTWRKLIEENPVALLEANKITADNYEGTERTRTLTPYEIQELANKLSTAGLLKRTEICMWIMLSCCCRIGEVIKARWEHIDLDAGVWKIPKENAKNRVEHTIYLSAFVLPYFRELRQLAGSSKWCFPREDNTDHVCVKSTTKQIRDRQLTASGRKPMKNRSKAMDALMLANGDWVPHDLRRTGATMMQTVGVAPEIIERCLNHVEPDKLRRTYQTHDYALEKREAWRLLGERLSQILTNVKPTPRRFESVH